MEWSRDGGFGRGGPSALSLTVSHYQPRHFTSKAHTAARGWHKMKDYELQLASLYNSISLKWVDMCSDLLSLSLQREHVCAHASADVYLILNAVVLRRAGTHTGRLQLQKQCWLTHDASWERFHSRYKSHALVTTFNPGPKLSRPLSSVVKQLQALNSSNR